MDKNNIEREKIFNKKEYDKNYKKEHYKQFNTNISKKFVKHKNDNSNNFTVNDKQFIFSAPENDVFLKKITLKQ